MRAPLPAILKETSLPYGGYAPDPWRQPGHFLLVSPFRSRMSPGWLDGRGGCSHTSNNRRMLEEVYKMDERVLTEAHAKAMQSFAVRRALREERRRRREMRKLTAAAVVATGITYALTWAHYGLGF